MASSHATFSFISYLYHNFLWEPPVFLLVITALIIVSKLFQVQNHNVSSIGPFFSWTSLSKAVSFRDPSTNLCSGGVRSWGCALGGKAAPLRGVLQRAGGLGYSHSTNGEECLFPRTFWAPGALTFLCSQGPSQRLPRKHRGLRPRSCELTLDLSLYLAHPAKSAGPRSIQQPRSCQALHPCLHWSPPEATWKGMALGRAATVAEVMLWS